MNDPMSLVGTTEDVQGLVAEIETLLVAEYKVGPKRWNLSGLLEKILAAEGETSTSLAMVKSHLVNLKDKLQSLPVLTIEVAFSPSKEFIEEITSWVKENVGAEVVVSIIVSDGVVGGAVVTYGGKYGDFGLAARINEVFSKKREEILQEVA
jgi:hypothetical protein